VLKRRHGLNRCRYRGFEGMQRWIGLGVIEDKIIQIGCRLAEQRLRVWSAPTFNPNAF
jgi:IS5 family transposase